MNRVRALLVLALAGLVLSLSLSPAALAWPPYSGSRGTTPAGIIPVTSYGATGDGSTDNSTAFQTAVNAISGTGLVLYIPAGTYRFTHPLVLPSAITIQGDPQATLVQAMTPSGGQNQTIFYSQYTIQGSATTLAANNTPGTSTLSVTASMPVGQLFRLSNASTDLIVRYYTVNAISGTGPYTVTVDRAVTNQWASADHVQPMSAQPTDIRVIGNGMHVTGTGDRYWECYGCLRGYVEGIVVTPTGGTLPNGSIAMSMDLGSRDSRFVNDIVDCGGGPDTGLALESNEASSIFNSRVYNAHQAAIDVYDSTAAYVIDSHAWNSGTGIALNADATSVGCVDCGVIGGSYNANSSTGVLIAGPATGASVVGVSANYNAAFGIQMNTTAGTPVATRLSNVRAVGNPTGILANGSGWVIDTADVSGNSTSGLNITTGGTAGNVTTVGGTGTAGIFVGTGTFVVDLANLTLQSSLNGWTGIDVTGTGNRVHVTNAHIQLDGTSSRGIINSGIVYATKVRVDGAGVSGTIGFYNNASSTLRENDGCDASTFGGNAFFFAGGAFASRGTVTANGTTAVSVSFPDLKANEKVWITPTTVAGTNPFVTKTAGTGFSITSTSGDTQVYDYQVQ